MRRFVALIFLFTLSSSALAQYGDAYVVPGGPYLGVYSGPFWGYYPGAYNGFWSNGFSLYGPPVPTYGSIPGFYGGSDQRLSNFPDLNYGWYGPWGWRGGYVPLGKPQHVFLPAPGVCEVHLPAADADVTVNGTTLAGGSIRRFESQIGFNQTATVEIEARWATDKSIGAGRKIIILRPGETVVADFSSATR